MTTFLRQPKGATRREQGSVLAMFLHVVLLLVVLGQIVFLASRYRLRFDATTEKLYSLTESTHRVIDKLDKRLLIEAYFSPEDKLNPELRPTRAVLDNFLDELVQLGKGRIVVQRFNPLDDKATLDKCQRIGIQPIDRAQTSSSSTGINRQWQGLRLVYGGERQKVLPQVGPQSSFFAEAQLTPAIKEVATGEKTKVGFMEWPSAAGPSAPGQPAQGHGFSIVRQMDEIARRYEFQNVKDAEGALVPEDIDTLYLFRPNDLTDRQKYVLDQFLMRGGTVVMFTDAADYTIGQRRAMTRNGGDYDAKDSTVKFAEQMRHYGVDLPGKLVADMAPDAYQPQNAMMMPQEYLALVAPGVRRWLPYPYFLHAVDGDWARIADDLAMVNGRRDDALANEYRKRFRPGIDTDASLFNPFRQIRRGPGFYWPCMVGLRDKGGAVDLPAGVEGKVLLWTSPVALLEEPPQSLNPLLGADLKAQFESHQAFLQKLGQRVSTEPRRQVPLMVDVRGTFPSFFAGRERPKKPSEIKEEEAKRAAEQAAAEAKEGEGEQADVAAGEPKDPGEPAAPVLGPEPPKPTDEAEADGAPKPVAEPAPRTQATAPGRLVVIGDSDFVRDDLVRGDYAQLGGPQSANGRGFFALLVDWIGQDEDLLALQSRLPVDRSLKLVQQDPGKPMSLLETETMRREKTNRLVALNVVTPCFLLLLLGSVVLIVRRSQKRSFLDSIGGAA